ncbi:ABC transporter substrate-binding protein [Actinomadura barringtoniae]|uniref:ABC transporter substrate-binding protein n=1 Tax=Actinomadura barringtoniae TaxID=1427535 RepID=A0A939PM84_9ACTN|nr:ABC transporter substrate-binding protein [Actinomadura barringtoniae]MBO2455381.1 ABC transporter substrate-binding protein [Actinomadura barringtoniae]
MNTTGTGQLRVGACLSLTGKHARFGKQARAGLEIWQESEQGVSLIIEDDQSDRRGFDAVFCRLAAKCDLLLGPYSTQLMRRAGETAAQLDRLVWNHGGSGDDVEAAHPGHVVSVLTPTSRYAESFLRRLVVNERPDRLWIIHGKGSFGRQVTDGADSFARKLGLNTARLGPGEDLPAEDVDSNWALLCAASFEEDVDTVTRARGLNAPPKTVCAVAAGVREFGEAVGEAEGIYGIGQWFPGAGGRAELGLDEGAFLDAYRKRMATLPDYPAAQAVATAAIATHCARLANSTSRDSLWNAASQLDTTTLFGRFNIDPSNGVQVGHEPSLVRWGSDGPEAVS